MRSLFLALALLLSQSGPTWAASPYPPSAFIEGIQWQPPSNIVRKAPGSDNWPMTWADDENQYTSWGDGGGFNGTNSNGRVSLGFARIEGPPESFQGYNVWGGNNAENPATFGGKSYGIISIGGVLYMWNGPGSEGAYAESVLNWSNDRGATWNTISWKFRFTDRFSYPSFLQFGRDYQGARDNYVYIYGVDQSDGSTRPRASLARADKNQILNRTSYEFFTGTDNAGNAQWSSDINQVQPVFADPNAGIAVASASYNATLGRYMLVGSHGTVKQPFGGLGIFDAPEPWGPWTTVEYTDFWMGSNGLFFANIPNKWVSNGGKDFYLVFTGFGSVAQDTYNHLGGQFLLKSGDGNADTLSPSAPGSLTVK